MKAFIPTMGIAFVLILMLCQSVAALWNNFTISSPLAAMTDDYSCTKTKPCTLGCCGPLDTTGKGVCGLGPEFCGKGCTSDCHRKSQCDPGWGHEWAEMPNCPLNVCCGKFGFCGTTAEFCGDKKVVSPQCNGNSSHEKTVGYWEAWDYQRSCGRMDAKDIPLGYYTHINFTFALVDPKTFQIAHMDSTTAQRYKELTQIKIRQGNLKIYLAIGGWAMNDPGPYRTTFSDLAASTAAQDTFFESLISFMLHNDSDGVDIDWETPLQTIVVRLRSRLNGTGRQFGLTVTLPASYWYLRGFDLLGMEPHVDWFNIMTYDIHGTWDKNSTDFKSGAYAHTNLTEINSGLELLWRNNINPGRVVLGLGFYGRSFTMEDPNCLTPGCRFKEAGRAGECTNTPGVLSATEIHKLINERKDVQQQFDKDAAVKIATWDKDQWVSWDDMETLKMKIDYANRRCLGGTMVWAVDLDDGPLINALGEAMGKKRIPTGNMTFPLIPEF